MKLLEELTNIINEAAAKTLNINGYKVQFQDVEGTRGYYPSQLLFRATQTDPDEFSDESEAYLHIDTISFEVVKSNDEYYILQYLLNNNTDYKGDEARLSRDLQSAKTVVYDGNDQEIDDPRITAGLKTTVAEYCKQVDVLTFAAKEASQVEVEPTNDGPDYDDHNDYYDDARADYYNG